MNILSKLTIKKRLIYLSLFISVVLLFVGVFAFFQLKKIKRVGDIKFFSERVYALSLELRRAEKDFMLRSIYDADFYANGNSKYTRTIKQNMEHIYGVLDTLSQSKEVSDWKHENDLVLIKKHLDIYYNNFFHLAEAYKERGFGTFGYVGELQLAIVGIEEHFDEINYLREDVLRIRLLESRYFAHKQKYLSDELLASLIVLKKKLRSDKQLNENIQEELIDELVEYKQIWSKIQSVDNRIGFLPSEGLQGEFRASIHKVEPQILAFKSSMEKESSNVLFYSVLILMVLIFSLGIFSSLFAYYTSKSIGDAISELRTVVQRLAQGNFAVALEKNRADEIGELQHDMHVLTKNLRANIDLIGKFSEGNLLVFRTKEGEKLDNDLEIALEAMAKKLRATIATINLSAANLASATNEISSASQTVAQGANVQAASFEEVSGTITQMTDSIRKNTSNASTVKNIAEETTLDMEKNKVAFSETLNSVRNISDRILRVGEIASKIDMLAINAGIEAARSGEAGKGFAVIAQEIRKLSENTRKFAEDISEFSKETIELSDNSMELLKGTLPKVKQTSELIHEIFEMSNEQFMGTSQIDAAINEMAQITQTNAATAEEMSTGAEELAGQAGTLKDTVSYFKTNEQNTTLPEVNFEEEDVFLEPTQELNEDKPHANDSNFEHF